MYNLPGLKKQKQTSSATSETFSQQKGAKSPEILSGNTVTLCGAYLVLAKVPLIQSVVCWVYPHTYQLEINVYRDSLLKM